MKSRNHRQIWQCGTWLLLWLLLLCCRVLPAMAQQETPPVASETAAAEPDKDSLSARWDRLIYVPFRELQKVFNSQDASVVLPYAEYLDLMKRAMSSVPPTTGNQDAVITSSAWSAVVEKDIARITAEFQINVIREEGWAILPVSFGAAAIGRVEPGDGTVLLKGTGQGQYELLLKGAGLKTVKLELLATVQTSPEDRSFAIDCPPTGIADLTVTLPEPDQTVRIAPLQVLLPTEAPAPQGRTVVKASLGATPRFEVRWNPRAGSKPVMDLLSSVASQTQVRIEPGLAQSRSVLNYEILRGELRELMILVPRDSRIIDVVAAAGRIRAWTAEAVGETHQVVRVELLVPATEKFQVELQTERTFEGDTLQLIGRSPDGKLQGVHADGVVREAGQLTITTDPSLTAIIQAQSGVRQTGTTPVQPENQSSVTTDVWEYSGSRGQLTVQLKPVEPRLLVDHALQYTFRDDELRVRSVSTWQVERAGVFQLALQVPESLVVDNVTADGMSEFHLDRSTGRILLTLTQKRLGAITVTILGHQPFDSTADNAELKLPIPAPEGVERETGTVTLYAPEFLDVITLEDQLVGLYPTRDAAFETLDRLRPIGAWNFTRRPLAMAVRTSPRPAQIAGFVGTTVRVEPEIIRLSSQVSFEIQNAGIDTFRIAVPESVAANVRFNAVSSGHAIRQRNMGPAENGWSTWTIVLQDETTGLVQLSVDWEVPLAKSEAGSADAAAEQGITVEPPRILTPFPDDQAKRRRVILTQARGEIRLLRHESLSITADSQGETTEAIDVRELERLEKDGYLAYRYFAQPASAVIRIRRHELHEVAATVISRAAVEVVTEPQEIAAWRVRLKITTSERQRLKIHLPTGCDLQAPLLDDKRTTMEKAPDQAASADLEAYYINISREKNSDEPFLLTLQYRCPIATAEKRPYVGTGSPLILRLPQFADDGSTVVQDLRLAVWAPADVSFTGDPPLWTRESASVGMLFSPLRGSSATAAAAAMDSWIGSSASDFATQGHVAVYRATGAQTEIRLVWWKRWFLLGLISGTLALVGLILRRTSWENRITMTLLLAFLTALLSLSRETGVTELLGAAIPGLVLTALIWMLGLVLGPGRKQPVAGPVLVSGPVVVPGATVEDSAAGTGAGHSQPNVNVSAPEGSAVDSTLNTSGDNAGEGGGT